MKATHNGHCQCCDRLQAISKGRIAKHGYQVIGAGSGDGFFAGTCPGSGHPPMEVSCELASELAKHARVRAQNLEERAKVEGLPSVDGMGWFHKYVPATWQHRKSYYEWVHRQFKDHENGDGRYSRYTALEQATQGNAKRAEYLRREAKNAISYAENREDAVKNWHAKELVERK